MLQIEGITEFWLRSIDRPAEGNALSYRPAMLIECSVNFRSLRAGLNHSEERTYTAWIPESDLAIDWDAPAAEIGERAQLVIQPSPNIPYHQGKYLTTKTDFEQYEAELVDK